MSKNRDLAFEALIIQIVSTHRIHEQNELQNLLKGAGYDVPQATLSRRLKKLKISKVGGYYKVIESSPLILPPILKIEMAQPNLILVHTYPGHANMLAYHFDRKYLATSDSESAEKDFLGTIAGDDTILVVVKKPESLQKIFETLKKDFKYFEKK